MLKLKFFQMNNNVGDVFSKKVASEYFSSEILGVGNEVLDSSNLLLIGSIFEWVDKHSYVCGTGLINSSSRLRFKPKKINCVRGPLTAYYLKKQGISVGEVFGDPGLLISKFYKKEYKSTHKIGIIPHYVDKDSIWINYCRELGIHILDVLSPLDQFVQQLQMCDVVYSSSLHGIIFSHSYGKRALWVDISDKVIGNGFKFFDYYMSVGVSPENVKRFKVSPRTNPYALESLAESVHITNVLEDIQQALYLTKMQLEALSA